MQPEPNPDDLHTILSRFSSWAGKQSVVSNGNHHKNGIETEEVREIPYEEAIRQFRKRRAAPARQQAQGSVPATDSAKREPAEPEPPKPDAAKLIAANLIAAHLEAVRADATSTAEPKAKVHAPVAAKDASKAVMDSAASPDSEPTPKATLQPRIDLTEAIPWAITPARSPARVIKDSREGPKSNAVLNPRAPTATPKLVSPEVALKANLKSEATAANDEAAKSVPQSKPLPPQHAVSSAASPENHSRARMKRNPRSSQAEPAVQVAPPSKRIAASSPAKPAIQPRPRVTKHAASGPSQTATQIGGQVKRAAGGATAPKRAATARTASRSKRHPAFRQILAGTVDAKPAEAARKSASKKQAPPDRNRRITTRFSTAEQRRIEKQAAQAGLTVSAWMRHCALAQSGSSTNPQAPKPPKTENRGPAQPHRPSQDVTFFAPPASSMVGNFLTLLRQRFLASPRRFSEQA